MLASWPLMHTLTLMILAAAGGLLGYAAIHDIGTRTIPDSVPASLLGLGVLSRLLAGHAVAEILAAGALFAVSFLVWRRGWLGGGDVKLATAFALIPCHDQVLPFVWITTLAGGVLGVVYLVLRLAVPRPRPGRRRDMLSRFAKAEAWRISRRGPLPYAVAIAAGGIYVLTKSSLIG